MGLGAEAFTILAILEAKNQASEVFEKAMAVMEKFGESAGTTADAVTASGGQIDESLTRTASGADALQLASARVAAAEQQQAAATSALADAEERLLAVSGQGAASEDELAAAAARVALAEGRAQVAGDQLTLAVREQAAALAVLAAEAEEGSAAAGLYADAQGRLRDASGQFVTAADAQRIALEAVAEAEGSGSAAAAGLAEANDMLARSQQAAADAAAQLAAAQAKQAGLGTADKQALAAQELAKAEKAAQSAGNDLSAAQQKQAAVQKAVAASTDEAKAAAVAEAAAQKKAAADAADVQNLLSKAGKIGGITALAMGAAGALMVKAAGNFQDATVHLVTDAGESQKNLGMVQAGILNVSAATGQSAESITDAMYHVESSGFHAASGLAILKTVAEGARVGGADLDTTSKALVGTLTAYYGTSLTASQATKDSTSLMNQLVSTVGAGDMRMQDLASSLSAVTPVAAAAHISFAQVGGAIATMTAQGMSARQSTQDLAHLIRSLQAPSNVSATEMKNLGLNANSLAKNLGTTGLAGTLNQMRNAVLRNTSGGYVMLGYLKQMTPAAQGLANQILAGSISSGDLTSAIKGLNPEQARLITQFKSAATSATGLKQTYTAAMSKLTGGATGLNVALMLTGSHMKDLQKNTATAAAGAKKASGDVEGWDKIQGTFNFKLASAKTAIENTGIAIGTALLPAATRILQMVAKILIPVAEWTSKHKTLTLVLFGGVAALAATVAVLALATKAFKAVKGAIDTVKSVVNGAITLIRKLAGVFKQTAESQAKDAKAAATAQEDAAAESAGVQEEKAEEAAAAQEEAAGEAAAAQEEAAAESSAGWAAAAAKTIAGWAKTGASMIAQAAKWVVGGALKVAQYVAVNVFGAEATESAWTLANAAMLGGILLVVAAVALAVYEIVKHWSTIVAGVKKAWNAVYDFISKVISDVISFVKSHWVLIVGIVTGPLGLAVVEVVKHFTQIKDFCSKFISDVLSWIRQHWRLLVSILGGPLGLAIALVTRYWGDIKHWFETGVSTVLGILRGLAHDVVSLGEDIVRGIWSGISGMGGWLWGQVKSFASNTLHSFESALGIGSPSKYTTIHGRMLGLGLANGILSSVGRVASASRAMASAALTGTSSLSSQAGAPGIGSALASSAVAPAGAGGGGTVIQVTVTGNTVLGDSAADKLAQKIGKRLATVHLPASGNKITIR